VGATSLAFEFRSGAAGSGIEVAPDRRSREPAARNWGWVRGSRERAALSAHDIRRALRRQGFRDIRTLERRGAIYQGRARDPAGQPVGVVVNPRNGAVLNVYRTR
jgi:hypothetical protein